MKDQELDPIPGYYSNLSGLPYLKRLGHGMSVGVNVPLIVKIDEVEMPLNLSGGTGTGTLEYKHGLSFVPYVEAQARYKEGDEYFSVPANDGTQFINMRLEDGIIRFDVLLEGINKLFIRLYLQQLPTMGG